MSSSSTPSTNRLVLSDTDTDILLSLLEWRYAITPTGELAPQQALMGNRRPVCHLVKREDRFVTEITTQTNWTRNLVQNDVLWGNTDFDAHQVLAQCKMLFPHMMNEPPLPPPGTSVRKILHLVQCETKAHFSLVNMMRLVKSFEQKLRTAVAVWPDNKQTCYEALDKIFCSYGFLVPTKITLGKKKIIRQEYVEDASRSKSASMVAKAQANKSLTRMNSIDDLKGESAPTQDKNVIKQPYELLLYNQQDGSGTQFEFWEIIKRTDLQPIYELLSSDLSRKVKTILYERSNPIQIGDIIRLQNVATSNYLAWRLDELTIEPGLCRPAADSSILRLAQWRLRRSDSVHVLNTQAKYGHGVFIEAVLGPVDNDLCVLLSPKVSDEEPRDRQEVTLMQNKDWNEDSSWWIEYTIPSPEPESVDMKISQIKPLIHGDIICISQNRLARYLSSRKVSDDVLDSPTIIRRRTSSFGNAGSVINRIRRMSLTRSTIAMAVNNTAMEWGKLQLIECGSTNITDDEKWIVLSDKVNHFAKPVNDLTSDLKSSNPAPPAQPTRQSATPRFLPAITAATPVYRTGTGTDYSSVGPTEILQSDQFTFSTTDTSSFSLSGMTSGITTVSLKSFRSASIPSPSASAFSWDTRNNYDAPIFDLLKKKKPISHRAKELFAKASLMSLKEIGKRFK